MAGAVKMQKKEAVEKICLLLFAYYYLLTTICLLLFAYYYLLTTICLLIFAYYYLPSTIEEEI